MTLSDIATYLPVCPAGLGPTIADRDAWGSVRDSDWARTTVAAAEQHLETSLPELSDDLYLEYSRTGVREGWQRAHWAQLGRMYALTLAECLQHTGRFMPAIEEVVAAECGLKSWLMPAHDRELVNFNGEDVTVDLGSAMLAWNLATLDHLLADRLSGTTRAAIRTEVARRIFTPYRAAMAAPEPPGGMDWLTVSNNWNAVCIAGVTGAALALVDDVNERAQYIKAAWDGTAHFLGGFSADGYCSEGVGYWNFGFGWYLMLAEAVFRATGGYVDFLDREGVSAPAQYGERIMIAPGLAPAFADCAITATPSDWMLATLGRRFALRTQRASRGVRPSRRKELYQAVLQLFPAGIDAQATPVAPLDADERRSWFAEAGVYIGRPGGDDACRMAVACKGGHNAEHHNHNDLGSYVVAVDGVPVVLDVGGEVYTSRTFSARRYESAVLNSYGHPVPCINGCLQSTGAHARAKVKATSFDDGEDSLVLDLLPAYDVQELEVLERSFTFERQDKGSLTVTDTMRAAVPVRFETALMTYGRWEREDRRTLRIQEGDKAVQVDIECGDQPCQISAEELQEHVHHERQPERIAIRLTEAVQQAQVTLRITVARSAPSG